MPAGGAPRPRGGGCLGAIARWFASAGILYLAAMYLPAFEVTSYGRALIVAMVIGLLNVFVRPLLVLLTLPITLLTLGAFVLVINALLLMLASWLLQGFAIHGFGWALLMAVVLAASNVVIDRIFGR